MNPDTSRDSFVAYMHQHQNTSLDDANSLFDDITRFIKDVNIEDDLSTDKFEIQPIPKLDIEHVYKFIDSSVCIHYESETIRDLIHPQIAHHSVEKSKDYDVLFEIFRTDDNLHLFRNKTYVGSYKTEAFHFLQGRFALELTNTIHHTVIDNWMATFHASTVTNGKESIMIIGDSGNGKSTLSVLLMAHGYDILCDDFTPLYEDNLLLYRYPAATSIKKGAFEALQPYIENIDQLKTHTNGPKKVNIKYVPPIHDYNEVASSFPCSKIVYVKYDAQKENMLSQVSASKILETLIPDSWISPNPTHASKFVEWLTTVEYYQLNYHDNTFAVSKFRDLFKES